MGATKTNKSHIYFALIVSLVVQWRAASFENLSAEDVLQRYTAGQSWQQRFSLHIQQLPTWERATSNPGLRDSGNVYLEMEIHKDNDRIHLKPTTRRRGPTGAIEEYDTDEEHFLTPYDGKNVCFRDTGPTGPAYCFMEDPMLQVRTDIGNNGGDGVFGWFRYAGFAPLQDLLPPHKAEVGIEDVDGTPCYVVSCKTETATTKAWFAPEKTFALFRCVIESDAGQFQEEIWRDKEGIEHVISRKVQELARVQFQEIDGHYVPTACEVVRDYFSEDGANLRRVEANKVTDLNLNPDFPPDEFALDFQDGKSIFMMRPAGGGLQGYEWRHGKIVPLVNQGAITAVSAIISTDKRVGASPSGTNGAESSVTTTTQSAGAKQAVPISRVRNMARLAYVGVAGLGMALIALSLLAISRRGRRTNKQDAD